MRRANAWAATTRVVNRAVPTRFSEIAGRTPTTVGWLTPLSQLAWYEVMMVGFTAKLHAPTALVATVPISLGEPCPYSWAKTVTISPCFLSGTKPERSTGLP